MVIFNAQRRLFGLMCNFAQDVNGMLIALMVVWNAHFLNWSSRLRMTMQTFVLTTADDYPIIELHTCNVVDGLQCPMCGGYNIIDDGPDFIKYFCWDCTAMYESKEQFDSLTKSNRREFIDRR